MSGVGHTTAVGEQVLDECSTGQTQHAINQGGAGDHRPSVGTAIRQGVHLLLHSLLLKADGRVAFSTILPIEVLHTDEYAAPLRIVPSV
jgi:hypothetical protein